MNINEITLGTDVEVAILNKKNKEIESAIPIIKEGKENPRDLGQGYKVHHDCTALEFNVPYVVGGSENLISTLKEGYRRIYNIIGKSYELMPIASYNFPDKWLQDDDARIAGCHPEMCAYEVQICSPPQFKDGLRSMAAHIHIGRKDFKKFVSQDDLGNWIPNEDVEEGEVLIDPYSKLNIIKLMDIYVGLPLTLIDTSKASKERKKLYGASGRHRPTHFGVEYRTPSNYWTSSPELTKLIHQLALLAVKQEIEGKTSNVLSRFKENIVRAVIDKGHEVRAKELIKKINLPNNIKSTLNYFASNTVSPFDLRKNWGI